MTDPEDVGEKPLDEFELGSELSAIAANNILPSRIVNKIGDKLKDKNIEITKSQLYNLVDKIKTVMRTHAKFEHTKKTKEPENPESNNKPEKLMVQPQPIEQNADMKKLVETIEQLNARLTNIEQNGLKDVETPKIKTVTEKDIETTEKVEVSIKGEEMYPLIEIPNDPESIVVLMKWLQYLVDKVGKAHLPDVLGYYVDIGWISDDVRLDLIKYSKGLTEENKGSENKKETPNLPSKDHLQSLLFIQKLKGAQIDERFMGRIEREMGKLAKSLDSYQFK